MGSHSTIFTGAKKTNWRDDDRVTATFRLDH